MTEDSTTDFRSGHASVRSSAKNVEQKEQVISKVITAAPGKVIKKEAKSFPLVLSFSEGAIAGTIKFVAAGDQYQDNTGKVQRYSVTKIVITVAGRKENFTFNEPLYRFFMAALQDPDARSKMEEWLTV
jgi:hypothetical protein